MEHIKSGEGLFPGNSDIIWGCILEMIPKKHNKLAFTQSAIGVIPDPSSFIAHNLSKYASTSMIFHFTMQTVSIDNKQKIEMHPIEN